MASRVHRFERAVGNQTLDALQIRPQRLRSPTPIPGMGSSAAAPARDSTPAPEPVAQAEPEPGPSRQMFDTDRAGKDDIVRRATLARLRGALHAVIGDSDIREVKGFDLASFPARKKSPASLETIFPVPIDLRDWSAKIPLNAPDAVRTLIDRLKSSV